MSAIYAALRDYFASAGTIEEHEDEGWVSAPAGSWLLVGQAYDSPPAAAVYGVLIDPIPADRRPAVNELLTRINSGLILGNFELDLDDGEVRFKAALAGEAPTREQLVPLVVTVHAHVDHWLPALGAVTAGEPPAEVFARAFNGDSVARG